MLYMAYPCLILPSRYITENMYLPNIEMNLPMLGKYQKWNESQTRVEINFYQETCQISFTMIFELIFNSQGFTCVRTDLWDIALLFKFQKKDITTRHLKQVQFLILSQSILESEE
jgi:hypothetical protein